RRLGVPDLRRLQPDPHDPGAGVAGRRPHRHEPRLREGVMHRSISWVAFALALALALLPFSASATETRHPGSLDPRFSSDGIRRLDFGRSIQNAYAVATQSDGKIVVAGGLYQNHPDRIEQDIAVIRLVRSG